MTMTVLRRLHGLSVKGTADLTAQQQHSRDHISRCNDHCIVMHAYLKTVGVHHDHGQLEYFSRKCSINMSEELAHLISDNSQTFPYNSKFTAKVLNYKMCK